MKEKKEEQGERERSKERGGRGSREGEERLGGPELPHEETVRT